MIHLSYDFVGLLGDIIQYPPTELIDSFYSINSQWLVGPVVMDYNSLLTSPVLEVYTYPQSVGVGKYSLRLYGRKRYMAITGTDVRINIDKNIKALHVALTDNQQITTTNDQLLAYETSGTYPKVTRIIIHSQMTTSPVENDQQMRYDKNILIR